MNIIINSGTILLLDGSLDTRSEAKAIFAPLVIHPKFEVIILKGILEKKYKKENNVERFAQIKKSLDSLSRQQKNS